MDERDMVVQAAASTARGQAVLDSLSTDGGDRLGLILFGPALRAGHPDFDRETVRPCCWKPARHGRPGTARQNFAAKRLRDRPQEQRVAILLTDGANTPVK